jgi:AraC-like DNA-binding protein
MDEHARMLMDQKPRPDDIVGLTQNEIMRALHGGDPDRDVVAKRLGMSPRTLQRRLGERDTTYKDLLDTCRKGLAEEHLKRSELALCEIAYLLGFSDQSAFNRAFKRWTGARPREFRLRAQGGEWVAGREPRLRAFVRFRTGRDFCSP